MRLLSLFVPAIAAGVLFLSACGDDSSKGTASPTGTAFAQSSDQSQQGPSEDGAVNTVLAGADWYVGKNNFVIGITNAKGQPQGGATAKVTIYDLADSKNPKAVATVDAIASAPGTGPVVVHQHPDGTHT